MPIVTLTTDFGLQDFYAGALKGALLRRNPELMLVDISHSITPYNIVQGAFTLQQAWREFPEGSIHLLAVNCIYEKDFRFVAATKDGHFFLAPDNGVLTLLFDKLSRSEIRLLPAPGVEHFAVKNIFADAVAQIASQQAWDSLGEPLENLVQRISLQPVLMPNRIRGMVIHVDNFENAIVNIRREVFEQQGKNRPFNLLFKRNDPISFISNNYCDVPEGDPLCLFNSAGFLEIAINMGKAASLLGLKVEEVVEVVFEE